ncbi:DcrB-related protein [Roseibium sp. HPY-6]|uniref:DcrB-related protein n=1 Tax=Roseibium sp. HPY-6 TaxID=3229852 RepID=UPI00338E33CD
MVQLGHSMHRRLIDRSLEVIDYKVNELSFLFPQGYQDDSVNVFTGVDGDLKNTSFVITRANLEDGGIEAYALSQLRQYEKTFPKYEFLAGNRYQIEQCEAREIEYRWEADQGRLHQLQLFLETNSRAIIFTLTAPGTLSNEHRRIFKSAIGSIRES